jgi:anti-sigma B factor antagonist
MSQSAAPGRRWWAPARLRRLASLREADAVREQIISGQLVIDRDQDGEVVKLRLYGELDLASAALLQGELEDVEALDSRRLVIDLGGLEFMDSTGLHLLLAAVKRSLANGHELFLRRGPRSVHRIFEVTQTVSAFRFED